MTSPGASGGVWAIHGAASSVHEDGSATKFGAGGGHGGIPEVAADVVDDLGSGFDGEAGGGGVVSVDGEDGLRGVFQERFDNREDTGLFFFGRERSGVGAGGFAAEVEDIGAFVEHAEGLGERRVPGRGRGSRRGRRRRRSRA